MFKDLTGKKFGRLSVIKNIGSKNKRALWLCKCDCGNSKELASNRLLHGTKSCGCLSIEFLKARSTHGESSGSKEYMIWRGVYARCMNPNHHAYNRYGGRGIKMCDRWLHSFENFLSDMGRKPLNHSLDRINNDGNYEPENCRWATIKDQSNNTRVNQYITYNNCTKTLMQWSECLKLPYKSLWYRIVHKGWSPEIAFNKPIRTYGAASA